MWKSPNIWLLVIAIVLLLAVAAPKVVEKLSNGSASVVGTNYKEDSRGVVMTPPAVILASVNTDLRKRGMAPITLDGLALARAINSEHGREPLDVRRWIAHAIINGAKKDRKDVFQKLTESKNSATAGYFARQRVDGRYAATNLNARLTDIEVASLALSPAAVDPTRGATNFFSPETQDKLYALAMAGDERYKGRITRDAAATRKLWKSWGLVSRGAPASVDPRKVEFFA